MHVCAFEPHALSTAEQWPAALPAEGFVWVALSQTEMKADLAKVQAELQRLCGTAVVDLHVSDLLNAQLPSNFDHVGNYDVLVLRRLAQSDAASPWRAAGPLAEPRPSAVTPKVSKKTGPAALRHIDTRPVGFVVFDRVLLSIHPEQCSVLDAYQQRVQALAQAHGGGHPAPLGHESGQEPGRSAPVWAMPHSPADLMLRLAGAVVDGYLDLRRDLTRQLDHWQMELMRPDTRFNNWTSVLQARMQLHQLDELCEDQRSAMLEWAASLNERPLPHAAAARQHRELLQVRTRDVIEHIERVVHHVRRLEQSAESAVQIHFSAQGQRTNDVMRLLTVLTAVFLPLNLIAGIFGMNFEAMPLLHWRWGFVGTLVAMGLIAAVFSWYFWRKRYLDPNT